MEVGEDADLGQKGIIQISNQLNQLVYVEEVSLNNGELTQVINTTHSMNTGMYIVQVIVGDQIFVKQLVVQQ